MNLIADACRDRPEVYTDPASIAEALSVAKRARAKGWLISGPDADGTFVIQGPTFIDERTGSIFDRNVERVPDGTFLVEYLKETNPFLRAVDGSRKPDDPRVPGHEPELHIIT